MYRLNSSEIMFCCHNLRPYLRNFSSTSIHFNEFKPKQKPKKEFGLSKIERKHLKRRISQTQSSLNNKHIYKTTQINSKYELAQQLKENEIYNKDGLLAFVKPFGIRRYKLEEKNDVSTTVMQTLNSSGFVSNTSIEEALPLLKSHYQEKDLKIIFSPERWMSGILLVSSRPKVTDAVKKSFRRSLALQKPHLSVWAVAKGLTVPEAYGDKVGIHLHHTNIVGKVPLIKHTFTKGEVIRNEVKPNVVEHTVLAHHKGNDMSLVEVNVLHLKLHFVRVWLAYCYSPVLGDLVFGGRVRTVMGKKTIVSSKNYAGYQPPDLPPSLLSQLHLNKSQSEMIPVHLHQAKLKLAQFVTGKEDLVLTASPPEHFLWTCKKLSLMDEGQESIEEGVLEEIEDDEEAF